MSAKFVSCTLGQLYRKVNSDGSVSGGPMYYLHYGLKDRGFGILGKILGPMYPLNPSLNITKLKKIIK